MSTQDTTLPPDQFAEASNMVPKIPGKHKVWETIPKEFNEWWDADRLTHANPFNEDSAAFWAWEGWQARAAIAAQAQQSSSTVALRKMLDAANESDSSRWEIGFRNIVAILYGSKHKFEIADVVERVRGLAQQAQGVPAPTQKESHAELDLHSNPARDEQQRQLAGSLEMGQPLGVGKNESASNPQPERAVARISGMDEYGPMIEWHTHWTRFALGTKLYAAAPQAEPCRQPISREQAIAIAREAAVAARDASGAPAHSYLPMDSGENWHPHEWVVEAIMAAPQAEPQPDKLAISPLEEQQMFDDWCPYKGNPDPRVVWAAAIDAANGMLAGIGTKGGE